MPLADSRIKRFLLVDVRDLVISFYFPEASDIDLIDGVLGWKAGGQE